VRTHAAVDVCSRGGRKNIFIEKAHSDDYLVLFIPIVYHIIPIVLQKYESSLKNPDNLDAKELFEPPLI